MELLVLTVPEADPGCGEEADDMLPMVSTFIVVFGAAFAVAYYIMKK